mmetsp:Transcript_33244/g.87438  ORF Transcript_33244/g.87438 Transcript_33244/m.87438 type:complete len:299 (+) Transcript_33244:116-1012(+)
MRRSSGSCGGEARVSAAETAQLLAPDTPNTPDTVHKLATPATGNLTRLWPLFIVVARLFALAGLLFGVLAVMSVYWAERPQLQLRQLLQPIQWALMSTSKYHPRGFTIVKIPPGVHGKLLALLDSPRQAIMYGGPDDSLEDPIIFGRTMRVPIPRALQVELQEAFRPLVSRFCNCELEHSATVGGGGVRVYQRGASLAPHLDWAHKFVVSATINVRQAQNDTGWPLHMRDFGGRAAHVLEHLEGEAVLYEGSRMLHGRPHALDDEYYAAAFVGFVPENYPSSRPWPARLFVNTVASLS